MEVTEEQPLQMESTKEVNVMRTKKKKKREKERAGKEKKKKKSMNTKRSSSWPLKHGIVS